MSKSNLGKRLVKDLKRSPAKAAVLGIMLVVACIFWWPLLCEWFGSEATADAIGTNETDTTVAAANAAQPVTTPTKNEINYTELLRQLENQQLLSAAALPNSGKMAFSPPAMEPPVEEAEPTEQEEPNQPQDETPVLTELKAADLGLVLTGVVIGPGFQVAKLNGITIAQDELIEIETVAGPLNLQVQKIGADYVMLKSETTEYRIDRNPTKQAIETETASAATVAEPNKPAKRIPFSRGES